MRAFIIVVLLLTSALLQAQNLPFINHTEAGILAATGRAPSFTAQTFNGLKINKLKLEAGITAGVDIYQEMTLLPVSAGVKWNPLNNLPVSPYISFNAGYSFNWLQRQSDNTEYDGGYILHPSMGVRIKTKNANGIFIGLGYRQQRAVIRQNAQPMGLFYDSFGPMPNMLSKEEYKFRRISLTLGLSM